MSNSSPWKQDSSGEWYKLAKDKYENWVRIYDEDARVGHRQRAQSRQRSNTTQRGSKNTTGYYEAESSSKPHRGRRGSEVSGSRDPPARYGTGDGPEMSTVPYKDFSTTHHEQSGYTESRQESGYLPTGYESSSYTHKPIPTEDSLTTPMDSLTIGHDPCAPISSSVPARGESAYIPSSLPTVIPEDSNITDQSGSLNARNEPQMHSSYQSSGRRGAGHWQRPRQIRNRRIASATPGDTEELDPTYTARNSDYQKFFLPGRVFSTLWTDAFAATTNDESEKNASSNVSYVIYGQRVHSKIRRFVVVRQAKDLKSCTCVSVTTYNGQGVGKRGINLNEHGLIYSSGKLPRNIKGMNKEPLKIYLSKNGEELTNPSLVNYGRIYTVECNVKVKDVGDLDSASRKLLRQYFKEVIFDAEFDEEPSQPLGTQATETDLTGVGGAGIIPSQGYPSSRPTGFVSSGINQSSSESHYGGNSGYDPRYAPQNSSTWASSTVYPPASYSSYPSSSTAYDPPYPSHQSSSMQSPAMASYPPNTMVTSSSSGTGYSVPPSTYNVSTTSSRFPVSSASSHVPQSHGYDVPRSIPSGSAVPVESYDKRPYPESQGYPAPSPSVVGGDGTYTSQFPPADTRDPGYSSSGRQSVYAAEQEITLDDTRESRPRRDSRTTRPPGSRRHRH